MIYCASRLYYEYPLFAPTYYPVWCRSHLNSVLKFDTSNRNRREHIFIVATHLYTPSFKRSYYLQWINPNPPPIGTCSDLSPDV